MGTVARIAASRWNGEGTSSSSWSPPDQISGFKDPRVPLLWPFWNRVFSGFAGLRVVPIFLVRSPHEIAMSIFLRSKGELGYYEALDVTAVHYQRLNGILDSWNGERAVRAFRPPGVHGGSAAGCRSLPSGLERRGLCAGLRRRLQTP